VRMFWKRERDPVDQALRKARPKAPEELVDDLGGRIAMATRPAPRRWSRPAFAAAFAVFMLGSFASFGGLGYAASSAQTSVHTMKRALAPAKSTVAVKRSAKSAAQDQYGEDKVQEETQTPVTSNNNDNNQSPPAQVAGATAGTPAATTSGTLPFTGFGLGTTGVIGSLLLAFGIFLRRRESQN
jgi:hypothetical protein